MKYLYKYFTHSYNINMKYFNIYNKIIQNRLSNIPENTYTEKHHIVPHCLGGTNEESNLVKVTTREHYILHHLLVKIYPDNAGISRSYHMLKTRLNIEKSSNPYSCIRKCEYSSKNNPFYGKHCSDEHKEKISKIHKGKVLSDNIKQKISLKLKGRPLPKETKQKLSLAARGKKRSNETKQKMSIAAKIRTTGRIWVNNGIIQKQIFPDNIPEGFVRGRLKRKN